MGYSLRKGLKSMAESEAMNGNEQEQLLVRELVGHVWVDSGQLVLTDPEYIQDLDPEVLEAATDLKHRSKLIMDGMAVAFRSGLRSARYPVYVIRFENGAIARIEIDLTGTEQPAVE